MLSLHSNPNNLQLKGNTDPDYRDTNYPKKTQTHLAKAS